MSDFTLNGFPVLKGRLVLPRIGVFVADLEVDAEFNDLVAAELAFEDRLFWKGTLIKAKFFGGRSLVRMVGGGAKLNTILPAKAYQGVPAVLPLQDAITEAGEVLSLTSDFSALNFLLTRYVRLKETLSSLVYDIAKRLGLYWRVLASGELWVGQEAAVEFSGEFVRINECPEENQVTLALEEPAIDPGQFFDEKRVMRVVHSIAPSSFRTDLYLES